jgi:hypothetical protein
MREYEVVDTHADNIGACSFCGYKAGKNEGQRRMSDWLKKRSAEGLRFKVLRSREFGDIGMIEYAPGSHAWRPVEAEGYLVIHCLMANGKHKGKPAFDPFPLLPPQNGLDANPAPTGHLHAVHVRTDDG